MAARNGIGTRLMLCAAAPCACAAHSQSPVAGTAQAYPAKPIRIIVPFTPGTGIDILARTAGQKLNERWGQGIVIDNRPGASGNIGKGFTAAQLNLSYCVATLLIDGEVFVDEFTQDKLSDPARMALAQKVVVLHDPAITAQGPKLRQMIRVEIHLKDGTRMERTREVSRAKEKFASATEIVAKFDKLATRVLPESQVRELRDAVLNLEQLNDAARLAQLLTRR